MDDLNSRAGALLLTLPLVSILAFIMAWTKHQDLPSVSRLAKETLILVPLGLPFFVPLAFVEKLNLGFWPAFSLGTLLAMHKKKVHLDRAYVCHTFRLDYNR